MEQKQKFIRGQLLKTHLSSSGKRTEKHLAVCARWKKFGVNLEYGNKQLSHGSMIKMTLYRCVETVYVYQEPLHPSIHLYIHLFHSAIFSVTQRSETSSLFSMQLLFTGLEWQRSQHEHSSTESGEKRQANYQLMDHRALISKSPICL